MGSKWIDQLTLADYWINYSPAVALLSVLALCEVFFWRGELVSQFLVQMSQLTDHIVNNLYSADYCQEEVIKNS